MKFSFCNPYGAGSNNKRASGNRGLLVDCNDDDMVNKSMLTHDTVDSRSVASSICSTTDSISTPMTEPMPKQAQLEVLKERSIERQAELSTNEEASEKEKESTEEELTKEEETPETKKLLHNESNTKDAAARSWKVGARIVAVCILLLFSLFLLFGRIQQQSIQLQELHKETEPNSPAKAAPEPYVQEEKLAEEVNEAEIVSSVGEEDSVVETSEPDEQKDIVDEEKAGEEREEDPTVDEEVPVATEAILLEEEREEPQEEDSIVIEEMEVAADEEWEESGEEDSELQGQAEEKMDEENAILKDEESEESVEEDSELQGQEEVVVDENANSHDEEADESHLKQEENVDEQTLMGQEERVESLMDDIALTEEAAEADESMEDQQATTDLPSDIADAVSASKEQVTSYDEKLRFLKQKLEGFDENL
eukprot:scaffold22701_cov123-Cylindrotheca_fusiformis.AAC.6